MKKYRFLAVTVGVLVLSAGLVLMTDSAGAAPPTKSGTPTQNWDASLPSASRFTTVFIGAVRDNNTGLVWEQAPDAALQTWFAAAASCVNKNVGGTRGWRLPSVVELASVLDGSHEAVAPFVPAVFTGIQPSYYSATTYAGDPTLVWFVRFLDGAVGLNGKNGGASAAWCARGGMNADAY